MTNHIEGCGLVEVTCQKCGHAETYDSTEGADITACKKCGSQSMRIEMKAQGLDTMLRLPGRRK